MIEVPITWFRDGFNRVRPAQLCACSIGEFEHILEAAWPWVARSYPVVAQFRAGSAPDSPSNRKKSCACRIIGFSDLCRLLETSSDKFVSATFRELDPKAIAGDVGPGCLRSPLGQTVRRYCEQAAGRLW
jgi:hypothetical protein